MSGAPAGTGEQAGASLHDGSGIGPVTALAFLAAIDDPTRFSRSRAVGAYLGLTPQRYASGEVDWSGRISKCGDTMVRAYLSVRGGRRSAHARAEMVCAQGVGSAPGQTSRHEEGANGACPQARRGPA